MVKPALISTTALLLILFVAVRPDAAAGMTVERISESALDELINAKNNKIVVTFMAAWCGPCVDELPALNKVYNRFKDRGLNLIGISIDLEGPRAIQPILDKLKVGFPVYWYGEAAVQKFSLSAIPMIFLVNDGRIVGKLPGRRSEKQLTQKIREFLDM